MGDVGPCWDNVVVERFFNSIKHDKLSNQQKIMCSKMLLHILNITIWSDRIPQTATNHPLSMRIPIVKCPVGLDQNILAWLKLHVLVIQLN